MLVQMKGALVSVVDYFFSLSWVTIFFLPLFTWSNFHFLPIWNLGLKAITQLSSGDLKPCQSYQKHGKVFT